jgi:hypothetical protein
MRRLKKIAQGVVAPNGNVVPGYPKIASALNLMDQYSNTTGMPPAEMQQVRSFLQDAARSNDASERRIGSLMLNTFDQTRNQLPTRLQHVKRAPLKIQNSNVLNALIEHAEGRREMLPSQVNAGLGLLKKVMPDLSATAITGMVDDKREAADWSREELVAFLNKASEKDVRH